jgi:S1-C subfamily serine protease
MLKKTLFILFIILISGLSGMVADHYFFPYFSTTKFFNKYDFLKKSAENVTIINKTEQVYVQEASSVSKAIDQAASSVVSIMAYYPNNPSGGKVPASKLSLQNPRIATGIIVTSDGIVMAYRPAIIADDTASRAGTFSIWKYRVTTADGNSYDAELLGADFYSNLAFLKIEASNLPVASFLNSGDIKPGEKVIAIGNSLGRYPNRFSTGLLSSFNPVYNLAGKALSISEKLEGVFETDAGLGNDYVGGPIIDYAGQVAGVIGSNKEDGKNYFFTLPANKVKTVIDKAIKKELENNPVLGAYYISLNKNYALANNIPSEQGAMIYSSSGQNGLAIISGSPAFKAGLKIGDIITSVGEDKITTENNLPGLLYKHRKGEEVELTIIRDGAEMKVKVQL